MAVDWETLLAWPSSATRTRWTRQYALADGDPYPEDETGRVVLPGFPRCRTCGEGLEWWRRPDCQEHPDCRNRRKCATGHLRRRMRSTPAVFPERASGA
jgi:hypothetical protein